MRITVMLTLAVGLAGGAQASERPKSYREKIRVCVRGGMALPADDFAFARQLTSRIMSSAGVSIDWMACGSDRVPDGADIIADLVQNTPSASHPGALAYAFAYEGTHVVVMTDRVRRVGGTFAPVVLAHVMSHEFAHLLQGTVRHSVEGIMKASWTPRDYSQMARRAMDFSRTDIALIQEGLQMRHASASSAGRSN
jgi:hypothetical protein